MPVREILGKVISFGLVSLILIGAGLLAFFAQHPTIEDTFPYINDLAALSLVGLGLLAGAIGTVIIGGTILDARERRREEQVHIVPRDGPPDVPPAWGMGNIGRPGGAGTGSGGGGTRVMSVSVSNWDAPVVIGALMVWTVVGLLLLAPR